MKRKLTALLVTMCLLLTAFPLPAAAAEKITIRFRGDEHIQGFQVGSERKQELVLEVEPGKTLLDIIPQVMPEYVPSYGFDDYYTAAGTKIDTPATYQLTDGETIVVRTARLPMTGIDIRSLSGIPLVYKGGGDYIEIKVKAGADSYQIPANEYDWSLVGTYQSGTKVVADGAYGLLKVDLAETAPKIKVKAVFREQSLEDFFEINVADMRNYNSISVEKYTPGQDWLAGETYDLSVEGINSVTAYVEGISPFYCDFVLSGNTSPDTKIDEKAGRVHIAANEMAEALKVKVKYRPNPALQHENSFDVKLKPHTLEIEPAAPKAKRGETIQLSAYIVYNSNLRAKVEAPYIKWKKKQNGDQSTITPDGKFTYANNEAPGRTVEVVAELLRSGQKAEVGVQERSIASIAVAAPGLNTTASGNVEIEAGQEAQIEIYGTDNFGERVKLNPGEAELTLVPAGMVEPTKISTSEATKIDDAMGKLIVGKDEFKDKLKVKVVYKADQTKMAEMELEVKRAPYTLKLKPKNSTVNKGESKQFTAYAVDNATHDEIPLKPTDLTWKAFVGTEAATQSAITAVGVFTCGAAETASEVAIKATLKYDSSKVGEAKVTVKKETSSSSNPPLNGYDNGNSNSSNNSSNNTGSPAAPAPQQPKKPEDNKPQDNKMDKSSEIIGRFQDIAGHWAQKAIVKAIEKGIFKGATENSFAPERQMSRAEFITVLGRMSEQATMLREVPFKDVDANAYYAQHVAWGAALGLMKGFEDGTFRPEAKITREQAAVIFANYLKDKKLPEMAMTTFADEESISSWAKAAVKKAAALGLLKGKDGGKFAPKDLLTRAEMAQILDNLSRLLEQEKKN